MIFAGDLVNLREGSHDDEWGEWFEAEGTDFVRPGGSGGGR